MTFHFEQQELEQKLSGAATQVLETMFFCSVEDCEQPVEETSGERIGASLAFHGACAGNLSLSMDRDSALDLASNFFGGGTGNPDEDSRVVMSELANMICGAMLSHLDKHSIFCLDSPGALPEGTEPEGEIIRTLQMEQGLLRLAFSIHAEQNNPKPGKVDAA